MTRRDRERVRLAGIVFAVLFAQVLLYPGVPQLVAALGGRGPLADGTLFLAVEFAGFVLFAGAWGAVSDAAGRRRPFVVAGAVGGAAGYLLLATLPPVPFGAVLVVRFLQGAFTIGALSLAMTTLMDLPGGGGRNMGAAGIAIGLGTALGAPVGGQLYELGVRVPLLVAGGLLLATAVVGTRLREWHDGGERPDEGAGERERDGEGETERTGPLAAVAGVRANPSLAVPYAFGFVDRFTAGFFALVGTVFFQTEFGLDAGGTGLLLGAFFLPFALLQYPFGVLSDRIGRVGPVAVGSLAYGVAVVAVSLAPSALVAGVVMVLVGAFGALCAPATLALVADLSPPETRGTAMGGFNVVGSLGFLVGIAGGGALAGAFGFSTAFLVAGLSEVALAVSLLPALLRLDADRVATFD